MTQGNAARETEGGFDGIDGARLRYRSWEPADPKATLLIVHGHGEHSGRYASTARFLAGHGIASHALDQRGHGVSEGRRGHVRRFDSFLQDLDRFRLEVAADASGPAFILGQSMGGLIVLRYLQEYQPELAGAVLISPWFATGVSVPRWKTLLAPVGSVLFPTLPLRTRLDAALLSHEPIAVTRYREDPLVHDVMTPRLFTESSAAMGAVFQRRHRLTVPLLFLLPNEDAVVDTRRSEAFARALSQPDVTVHMLDGHYHEPLHETGRASVRRTIAGWIHDRLPDVR